MKTMYVNCGLKINMKGTFAVMNTTWAVVKKLPAHIVSSAGRALY